MIVDSPRLCAECKFERASGSRNGRNLCIRCGSKELAFEQPIKKKRGTYVNVGVAVSAWLLNFLWDGR